LLPGKLAGTPWPGIVHAVQYDLQALKAVGVTQLISLTEEPFQPEIAASHRIACHAFPMPDMHPPSQEQGIALCERIDQLLAAGEVVAVHCRAGLGRTGTVLACYWLWLAQGRLSAVKALEDVRRLEPGWVQSAAQVRFLEEFSIYVSDAAGAQAAKRASRGELEIVASY
jgi:atypical dual specificity phosphatase